MRERLELLCLRMFPALLLVQHIKCITNTSMELLCLRMFLAPLLVLHIKCTTNARVELLCLQMFPALVLVLHIRLQRTYLGAVQLAYFPCVLGSCWLRSIEAQSAGANTARWFAMQLLPSYSQLVQHAQHGSSHLRRCPVSTPAPRRRIASAPQNQMRCLSTPRSFDAVRLMAPPMAAARHEPSFPGRWQPVLEDTMHIPYLGGWSR